MIKSVTLLYRNPALTQEEFRDYWVNVHAPMVRAALPSLIVYNCGFPLADAGSGGFDASSEQFADGFECDAIVELGFSDHETMERELGEPAFNSPERLKSSSHLMDLPRCRMIVLDVVDIPLNGQE